MCLHYRIINISFNPELSHVFIGYPQRIKAYKLYDIEHKRVFISRDVVFHEIIFPFHNISKTQIPVDPLPGFSISKSFHECNSHSHATLSPTSNIQTSSIRDENTRSNNFESNDSQSQQPMDTDNMDVNSEFTTP